MAEVRLQQVSKSFRHIRAIDDLSLTIGDGEFIVLLGPTGAGKTTTLRLVAGLEKPDKGAVIIDGIDVTTIDPSERDVTFVFQQYSLYPHYTVFENMAFPLKAPARKLSSTKIKKRVEEIAELLHIEHKLQNKATQLSGGEMQRVSIGRALVREPKVFLMDEPLSSLDAKLRENLRLELKRIQQDLGATILYVTHDQLEAMTLSDRIGVLDTGKLIQVSSPREIYEHPVNINSARRLGSPQINIFAPGNIGLTASSSSVTNLGLRPEDIHIDPDKGAPATVVKIEHLGVESVVTLAANGEQFSCLLSDKLAVEKGDDVFVTVNLDKILEFDKSGRMIAGAASAD